MRDINMGEVIAERIFEARDDTGSIRTIILRIGKPIEDPQAGGDWCCPYQISGFDKDVIDTGYGVDAIQALLLVFQKVAAELDYYQKIHNLHLTWLDMDDLNLTTGT